MSADDQGCRALVASLSATIDRTLAELLPAGAPCVLIDFPWHGNVGDHAIWLGQRAALRRAGHRVTYACGARSYRKEELAVRSRGAIIVLSGGGNLGDLWPDHQRLREAVIGSFPDVPIFQLPQSVQFRDQRNLERARSVLNAHPNLVLLLRDRQSLEMARANFTADCRLCPDMALALGPLERAGRPAHDVIWLGRSDKEAAVEPPALTNMGVERVDWIGEEAVEPIQPRLRAYDDIARRHLARGRRLLSQGRVVLTDRLHGHVLCTLMSIPHVLLNNSYGKSLSFWETWTSACAVARFSSPASAADAVSRCLEAQGGIESG